MAVQLFKLVVNADTETTTETIPTVQSFFYNLNETERVDGTITIPATLFADDEGNPVVDSLTTVTPSNGYYLLFINGVLQQSNLYTVNTDGSNIIITEGGTVPVGAPIVLVVNNFAPESTSTTTITT